jgi:hypothetical protein
MKWECTGADRASGADRVLIVEAETEDSARRRANRQGLVVESVRPLDPNDSALGAAVPGASALPTAPPVHGGSRYAAVAPPPPPSQSVVATRAAVPAPVATYPPPAQVIPTINVQMGPIEIKSKGASPLGIASLVMGIICLLSAWVPIIGCMTIPVASIGLLLAGIGLAISAIGGKSGVGFPVAGLIMNGLALLMVAILTAGTVAAVGAGAQGLEKAVREAEAARAAQAEAAWAARAETTAGSADSAGESPVEVPRELIDVRVTSRIVKKVGSKHRYFFDVRNFSDESFDGTVAIWLMSGTGLEFKEAFGTSDPVLPGRGNSVYVDLSTGPPTVHAGAGIDRFRYEVQSGGNVVARGEGAISNKFEDTGVID